MQDLVLETLEVVVMEIAEVHLFAKEQTVDGCCREMYPGDQLDVTQMKGIVCLQKRPHLFHGSIPTLEVRKFPYAAISNHFHLLRYVL